MSPKLECIVEIHSIPYELNLDENGLNFVSFEVIYLKTQEILRTALKEDIDFNTHEFEVCFQIIKDNLNFGNQTVI